MALEILFNKAEHHHENVQFRRVANGLLKLFEEQGWNGLLIGNPSSEDYYRFRADAILLYDNGLVIIDFKDYEGQIEMPLRDEAFEKKPWFLNTKNGERIKIYGGEHFPNPFRQLKSYRQVMYGVINDDSLLKYVLDPSRVCALNIFSGPITANRSTSRKVPYYQLVEEADLHTFLYDYSSKNNYDESIARKLKSIFPSDAWQNDIIVPVDQPIAPEVHFKDGELEPVLKDFFASDAAGILVLESMDINLRDKWMKIVNTYVQDNIGSETHLWSHSTRIASRIAKRTFLQTQSLYVALYSGKEKTKVKEDTLEGEEELQENIEQEVIGLRSDADIDIADVFIIPDAHLVSRSLHQSDLIRFGTGRLLEDLFNYLKLDKTQRKLVLIGDPYMLSYGRTEDAALNIELLNELFEDGNIIPYRSKADEAFSETQLFKTRNGIAASIDHDLFNRLNYQYDESLEEVQQEQASQLITKWFSNLIESEPGNAVLFYSKLDARKTNLWIKEHLLKNGRELAAGDLLLINNNITIPDLTGLGHPTNISNGSYLRVIEVYSAENLPISSKSKGYLATLTFRKLRVKLLSAIQQPVVDILMLENYFQNLEDLGREEQIAIKIFTSQRLGELRKKYPFEKSSKCQDLQSNRDYIETSKLFGELELKKSTGEKVLKKDQEAFKVKRNKIERSYKKDYNRSLMMTLRKQDPYVNAAHVNYGWAITVHKSVGSQFENVLFKTLQSEDAGIANQSYFRWLYSGLTAANNKAFIIHPQLINPFSECEFIDAVEITEGVETHTNNELLDYSSEELSDESKHWFSVGFNHNAAMAIVKLMERLSGLQISSVRRYSDFLNKVIFSDQEKRSATIALNNRGNLKISSIRIETCHSDLKDIIQNAIDSLYQLSSENAFPNDYRGEIYQDWRHKLSVMGIELELLEEHNNEDRLHLKNGNDQVKFNLRYTSGVRNRGHFTSTTITRKTNQDLVLELKKLLSHG
ncbi:hypothetical protein EZV76_00390 [Flagellimonas alvinocaridis]|uniref:NERD domain-containing protein n=1 Tax=Flagellimonas alvinocaridis TaxID=2530200 RepID=A0A4S8RQ97_9FLAO|nr:hypothetical protein [Allomuricauda alvinocaridis]THV60833.1 hypothetical protein EZV76_00390 [Allomuricauda alvinocaridis]